MIFGDPSGDGSFRPMPKLHSANTMPYFTGSFQFTKRYFPCRFCFNAVRVAFNHHNAAHHLDGIPAGIYRQILCDHFFLGTEGFTLSGEEDADLNFVNF